MAGATHHRTRFWPRIATDGEWSRVLLPLDVTSAESRRVIVDAGLPEDIFESPEDLERERATTAYAALCRRETNNFITYELEEVPCPLGCGIRLLEGIENQVLDHLRNYHSEWRSVARQCKQFDCPVDQCKRIFSEVKNNNSFPNFTHHFASHIHLAGKQLTCPYGCQGTFGTSRALSEHVTAYHDTHLMYSTACRGRSAPQTKTC